MNRTATLREQHDQICELAREVSKAAELVSCELGAERVLRLLGKFDEVLTAHLALEDNFLYPELRASSDPETAGVAIRYSNEMGGLVGDYAVFAGRWTKDDAIAADPDAFRLEWRKLLAALALRIERENNVLYPLAEAMYANADRKSA